MLLPVTERGNDDIATAGDGLVHRFDVSQQAAEKRQTRTDMLDEGIDHPELPQFHPASGDAQALVCPAADQTPIRIVSGQVQTRQRNKTWLTKTAPAGVPRMRERRSCAGAPSTADHPANSVHQQLPVSNDIRAGAEGASRLGQRLRFWPSTMGPASPTKPARYSKTPRGSR